MVNNIFLYTTAVSRMPSDLQIYGLKGVLLKCLGFVCLGLLVADEQGV